MFDSIARDLATDRVLSPAGPANLAGVHRPPALQREHQRLSHCRRFRP